MFNVCLHEIIFLPLKRILKKCFMICAALASPALPVQSSKGCGVCIHPCQWVGLKLQGSLGAWKGENGKAGWVVTGFHQSVHGVFGHRGCDPSPGMRECGHEPEDAPQNSRQLVTGCLIHPPCRIPFILSQIETLPV